VSGPVNATAVTLVLICDCGGVLMDSEAVALPALVAQWTWRVSAELH
jgi:hypothetical protein